MSTEDIAARFKRDTATHEMTVLHDEGLYRHLRFQGRKQSFYWFDLITVPHALIFRGDGESYVFSRLEDMFQFFRHPCTDMHYWAEKLTSDRDSVMRYDQEIFERLVKAEFVEAVREGRAPRGLGKAVREEILDDWEISDEWGARRVVDRFEFFQNKANRYRVGGQPDFRFEDAAEWNLRDFHWWFKWACQAIPWGIAKYDLHRAIPAPATSGVDKLVRVLKRNADRACWLIVHGKTCALLVATSDGGLQFAREMRWSTVEAAVESGRVLVGERADEPNLPPYRSTSPRWPADTYTYGRTIALASTPSEATG